MHESRKRIAYWDNVKWFMILLVVIGHFAGEYFDQSFISATIHLFIYAFHMPVFFFVSGVFYDKSKAKNSFVYFIACGLLLKLAFALCNIFMGNEVKFYLLYEGDIPWFMFALAYHYILMFFFGAGNRKYMLVVGILLACVVGYENIGDYLVLSRTILFFPFFIIGTMFTPQLREKANAMVRKYAYVFYPLAVVVLLFWGAACLFKTDFIAVYLPLLKGRFVYPEEVISYGIWARLGCYLLSTITGAAILILCPRRRLKGISYMGTKTINVYFWHWICYMLLAGVLHFDDLYHAGFIGKALYFVIAVVLCIVLSSVKLFDWPLRQVKAAIRFDAPKTEKTPDTVPQNTAEEKEEQPTGDEPL